MNLLGFVSWLAAQGYSSHCLRDTPVKLNHAVTECGELDVGKIEAFIVKKLKTCTRNSINAYLKAIKLYGRYTQNPELENLKLLKKNNSVKGTFSVDELRDFLKIRSGGKTDYWLFFNLMAMTGMRPGECAALTPDCISFGEGLIYLDQTKTNTPRKIPIPPILIKPLEKACVNDPIFHSNAWGWSLAFRNRLKILGISRKNLTCYSLRHTFITLALQQPGTTLYDVQDIVGHRRGSAVTAVYYHPTLEKIKTIIASNPVLNNQTVGERARYIADVIRSLGVDLNPETLPQNKGIVLRLWIPPPLQIGEPHAVAKPVRPPGLEG